MMAYQNTRQSSNIYTSLSNEMGETMEGIQTREDDLGTPQIILGSEDCNTPKETDIYSDGFTLSSPTQKLAKSYRINISSSPPKPPTKRHRTTGPDTGFLSTSSGTPQTTQEAIIQARDLLCKAVGLSKDPIEQANLLKLGAIFEDFVNGQPINRTVETLKVTTDKLEKATKSFQIRKNNTSSRLNNPPSPPPADGDTVAASSGLPASNWNPDNQL
jgi:hypothetical protein